MIFSEHPQQLCEERHNDGCSKSVAAVPSDHGVPADRLHAAGAVPGQLQRAQPANAPGCRHVQHGRRGGLHRVCVLCAKDWNYHKVNSGSINLTHHEI